ncbi:MAG: methyltransferase domain-containing protein [Pseudomonadota bacterium]
MPSLNRIVMHRKSRRMIQSLNPPDLKVAEISGWWGEMFDFAVYDQYRYPEYDICQGPFRDADGRPKKYDLIMANQVWEHLDRPYAATRHVRQMLKKGGHFWVAVPFFIPFHAAPNDCSRWSARGLRNLLVEAGFDEDAVQSEQWGNRNAALRNMEDKWPPAYDEDTDALDNDPQMPICAWAMARRT